MKSLYCSNSIQNCIKITSPVQQENCVCIVCQSCWQEPQQAGNRNSYTACPHAPLSAPKCRSSSPSDRQQLALSSTCWILKEKCFFHSVWLRYSITTLLSSLDSLPSNLPACDGNMELNQSKAVGAQSYSTPPCHPPCPHLHPHASTYLTLSCKLLAAKAAFLPCCLHST